MSCWICSSRVGRRAAMNDLLVGAGRAETATPEMRRSRRPVKIRGPAGVWQRPGREPSPHRRATLAGAEWPFYDWGRIPPHNQGPDLGPDPQPTCRASADRHPHRRLPRLRRPAGGWTSASTGCTARPAPSPPSRSATGSSSSSCARATRGRCQGSSRAPAWPNGSCPAPSSRRRSGRWGPGR